jgi:acetyl-CoA acetyltransferase
MRSVYVIGLGCTAFGKRPETSFKALTRECYENALLDAGMGDGGAIEQAWFGNCGMGAVGQSSIRGQVCMTPLVREGRFPERAPVVNVEGGCATASMACHGAWKDVASGDCEVSLAIGVEKLVFPDAPERTQAIFDGAIDRLDPEEWRAYYATRGEEVGRPFSPQAANGTIFMDTYAMQAAWHMKRWGTTRRQIAAAAAKNHANGALNPKAQRRRAMTVEEVLADREISWPLTRAMCSPIGDGAAAAILCSEDFLAGQPAHVRDRAIRVRASALAGGKYRAPEEPGLSRVAARKAYARAGLDPADVDVVELHDATAFSEIYQLEMLGFVADGQGGPFVEAGETGPEGRLPVNLSGGLVSKGHPIGATGLSMIYELALQLRGEAGPRQRVGARIGLAENGGGVIGFDEAACSVILLEGPRG